VALCAGVVSLANAGVFVIEEIEVQGLQRVSLGNVLSQLSIREGDQVVEEDAKSWLHQIYQTGYFYSVDIEKNGNSLVIDVVERPAIETIEFDGNSSIPTDTLENVFADVGLSKGEIFSRSLLENIELELEKQYGAQGRYNAHVEAEISPLTRNRVDVKLQIVEGPVAKIKHIEFVGNGVFEDVELFDVMRIQKTKPGNLFQGMSKRNQFANAALTGDMQRVEDFYFDRGYLDFQVESQQVSISENKSDISIALNMVEGLPYEVSEVEVAGDLKHLSKEIKALILIEPGQIYSRQTVSESVRDITDLLGEHGYAMAKVRDFRQPDPESQTVKVIYQIQLGYPVYVNRIIIQGNSATNDEVIRRELRQLERALVVNKNIKTSKARLERLGYFSSVVIKSQPITGRTDLVDLVVTVVEAKDSQISISGGYAEGTGAYGQFSIEQNNFIGKGVDFSTSVTVNDTSQQYQLSVENPFFTLDGVSLGAEMHYRHSDYSKTTFSTYATNTYGGTVNVGYPLSENQRVKYGFGLSHDELFLNEDAATLEMTDFRDTYGNEYDIATTNIGWSYNTLNGTFKADDGTLASANLEVSIPPGDLHYYRATLNAQKYFNFADDFAFRIHTDLGYGAGYGDSSLLPFYKNFRSGGPRSVRGYQAGSLGPRGTLEGGATASPIGGNIKVEYGAELLVPTPFIEDRRAFRTSLFVDAGNVFTDQCRDDNQACDNGIDLSEIRYSAGVDLTWITAIAPLSFSYSWPLNKQDDDFTQNFKFTIGTSY